MQNLILNKNTLRISKNLSIFLNIVENTKS